MSFCDIYISKDTNCLTYLQTTESHSNHLTDNFVGPRNRNCGDDTGAIRLAVGVMLV